MKLCWACVALGAVVCWTGMVAGGPSVAIGAGADPAYDRRPGVAPADRASPKRVSVFRERSGKRVLVVEYPWKVHAKPSVEVRLLGQGEPNDLRVQPMYFRWKYMKGDKTTLAVYRVQDTCEETPASAVVREGDVTFEVLGDRNSMGIPAVCVARTVRRRGTERKGGPPIQPGAAAAFPLLELWAMNNHLLYFNLPEAYFDKPGRMRVWFLRDDRVLWSEDLAWPGTGNERAKP